MEFVFRRSYRGDLKAVIHDWAGTTVDYGCYAPAVVFQRVFEQHGVPITIEEARAPMGMGKKDHVRTIMFMDSVRERWVQAHQTVPTEAEVETLYAEFIPQQLECIADYSTLITGTLEAVADFRARKLKIGSTTGYDREMLNIVLAEARQQGYEPDSAVSASEVPMGRPAPWMCSVSAMEMNCYPPESVVKIGDTVPDIDEGLNAGMWTIGVAKTGNEIGLTETEISQLQSDEYAARLGRAYQRLQLAGAHYVVDSIAEVLPILDDINRRLRGGEKP